MTLSGHFILLNFMDIMVIFINILFKNFCFVFSIFSKNNIICTLWFFPNKDSLDRVRQKANSYSLSDDSSINQIKKNSYKLSFDFTYFDSSPYIFRFDITDSYYTFNRLRCLCMCRFNQHFKDVIPSTGLFI